MSMALFIIGIVLGGIATLVSLIFLIISLAGGKNQNAAAWGVGFVIALCVLIISVYQVVRRIGEKVKSGVEWIAEHKDDHHAYDNDNSYQKEERQNFLDTLKKYTHPAYADKVPVDFYKNEPAERTVDSRIIVPFLYPLSIRYDDMSYSGEILSDVNDTVYLSNIRQMAFDENFVIAKVDNSTDKELLKEGRGEIEYVLFDQRSREFLTFVSYEQLVEKAGKIGYVGKNELSDLATLYSGWIDPLDFDY